MVRWGGRIEEERGKGGGVEIGGVLPAAYVYKL